VESTPGDVCKFTAGYESPAGKKKVPQVASVVPNLVIKSVDLTPVDASLSQFTVGYVGTLKEVDQRDTSVVHTMPLTPLVHSTIKEKIDAAVEDSPLPTLEYIIQ
jgi:hypothetical protein